jgi:hypothetical protein
MIKKILQLFWFEKTDTAEKHRTFRKSYARFRKHGFAGMQERLHKDYLKIEQDLIARSQLEKKYYLRLDSFLYYFLYLP